MSQSTFQEVIDRLRKVTEISTETELGERLGFTQSAWSKRKMRGSLPRREIDALVAKEELNPEFIYNGTGDVHTPVEGEAWHQLYAKRAQLYQFDKAWLVGRGHTEKLVDEVRAPKPGGHTFKVLAMLHDWGQVVGVDLNWLLVAQRKSAGLGTEPTSDEAALLAAYRRASDTEKEMVLRMVGAKPPKKR